MPQPKAEDPDPLLSFSSEAGAAAPLDPIEPVTQPVAPSVDPPPVPQPSPPPELLLSRIEQLERALADSTTQVSSLKSEVTTLVGAVGDIRKLIDKRRVAPAPAPRPRASRPASAIAGLLIGVTAAIFGWMWMSRDDMTIAAPVASAAPVAEAAAIPAATPVEAAPVETKPVETAKPLQARRVAKVSTAPQPLEATRYVGTLSIDSSPGGEVFLNRKSAGHTPLRLTNLRAGSHLIWIEREGYRRWTGVVQVPADRVSRLSAELEPIAGR